ncbi:transposase (plasmid) [Nocardia sp. CA-084685]|uniref:transposase n=1 Tax=Nocardia sp. CA-084685 TaxID=3239970 RepID=UPI003D95D63E
MLTQRVAEVFDEFDGRAGAARIAQVLTDRGLKTNKQAVRSAMRKQGLRAARLPLSREELTERVIAIFHTHDGRFGAERVAVELARAEVAVSEATVAKILRENGLRAKCYRGPEKPSPLRGPVRSTAHPLQRVGAFVLMALAGVDDLDRDPESLTQAEFDAAISVMRADVAATADLPNTKAPGSFWLAASYLLWPNSPMNNSGRAKAAPAQRRERIEAWRTYPTGRIGVPCSLCGSDACGWYGKADIPLGAAIHHRNTTPPGHEAKPCAQAV